MCEATSLCWKCGGHGHRAVHCPVSQADIKARAPKVFKAGVGFVQAELEELRERERDGFQWSKFAGSTRAATADPPAVLAPAERATLPSLRRTWALPRLDWLAPAPDDTPPLRLPAGAALLDFETGKVAEAAGGEVALEGVAAVLVGSHPKPLLAAYRAHVARSGAAAAGGVRWVGVVDSASRSVSRVHCVLAHGAFSSSASLSSAARPPQWHVIDVGARHHVWAAAAPAEAGRTAREPVRCVFGTPLVLPRAAAVACGAVPLPPRSAAGAVPVELPIERCFVLSQPPAHIPTPPTACPGPPPAPVAEKPAGAAAEGGGRIVGSKRKSRWDDDDD